MDDDPEITFTADGADEDDLSVDPRMVIAENGAVVLFPFGLSYYAESKGVDMVVIDPVGGIWHYKDGQIEPAGELKKKLKSVT